jgi:thioester reductase-like protein
MPEPKPRRFSNLTPTAPFADVEMLSAGDASSLPFVISDDAVRRAETTRRKSPRRVLVLGGTGFVGLHLIHRLMLDPAVVEVVAIGRSQAGVGPLERIVAAMGEYHLATESLPLEKLACVSGEITAPRFGLEAQLYARLSARIDTVFHSASLTDYSKSYRELRADWVEGLYEAIDFCLEGPVKHLTYIGSTIAHLYRGRDDFARPDSWWYSGYAQMKWVNQSILTQLARRGLPMTVCEAPYVLGSQTVGLDRGLRYTFWRAAAVARALGVLWEGPGMNFAPVDLVVDTVIDNAHRSEPLALVRPRIPEGYTMRSIAGLIGCKVVRWDEFHRVVSSIPLEAVRRIFPPDLPEILAKTNFDPIFPTERLANSLPSPADLMKLYLARLDLDGARIRGHLGLTVATADA